MKKLLLHIGYPKTATTTLQEDVFVNLHNAGKINYLGRTTKSSHTRSGYSKFNGKDWVWQLRHYLYAKSDLPEDMHSMLDVGKSNLLSDEDFTFHGFYHYMQFGNPIDNFELPTQLKKILGEGVDVELLVTIRNQADLIFSSFLQKYRFIKQYYGDLSFSAFLNNEMAYNDKQHQHHLGVYDFEVLVTTWESVFNTKAKIVLYEDIKFDNAFFFEELALVIASTTAQELLDLVGYKQRRKRTLVGDNIKISYKSLSGLGRFIEDKLFGQRRFERILEKRYHMRASVLLNWEKRLFFKNKSASIPNISEEDRAWILNHFSASNRLFAEKRGISLEKMLDYKYIQR